MNARHATPRAALLSIAAAAAASLTACNMQAAGSQGKANANALSCRTERDMMTKAVENFTILEGRAPSSEEEMVPAYMVRLSDLMDLAPSGDVVASPGGGC